MRNVNKVYLEKITRFFWERVSVSKPCWNWTGTSSYQGYGVITTPDRKKLFAHRFSYFLHFGETDLFVCHTCDNRGCVNPGHLFAGTQADNMADMTAKGRRAKPCWIGVHDETHPRSKLTNDQIIEIFKRLNAGETGPKLAKEYDVYHSAIYRAKKRYAKLFDEPKPKPIQQEIL